jgi:hypothetical protein
MGEVLELFAQILVLRRGPQDLPASGLLLLLTLLGYVIVNCVSCAVFPPTDNWPALLLLDVVFLLLWNAALLVRRPERILQTTTAVFGYQLLLAPLLVPLAWLQRRFEGDPAWHGPLVFVGLAVVVWSITINSRIIRAALEGPMLASVLLVISQTFVEELLQLAISAPAKS